MVAVAPVHLFKRKNTKGKNYYTARFYDESGRLVAQKSLRTGNRTEAVRLADKLLREGVVGRGDNPDALAYCREFWGPGSSYFKSRRLKGKPLSESYRLAGWYALKRAEPFLKGKRLLDLRASDLEAFSDELAEEGAIHARMINLIMATVRRPVTVFCKAHHVPDPLAGVEHHAVVSRERGILVPAELAAIVQGEKSNPRDRLVVLLGALCGLRKGEIRGAKLEDVNFETKTIHVCRNIAVTAEGERAPKCGSTRTVPVPDCLLDLIKAVHVFYKSEFIVPNLSSPSTAPGESAIRRAFTAVLDSIGIGEKERKARNLVLHGLRHTFISLTQNSGLPDFVVARLAGHKELTMTKRYTHSEGLVDFRAAREAVEDILKAGKA